MISKINSILKHVEEKDAKLHKHLEETGMYSYAVAKAINLSFSEREMAFYVGLIHDIGKVDFGLNHFIDIDNDLKEKSDDEKHVYYGSIIVKTVSEIEKLSDYIKHHHEHWDGTGYPNKLSGEDIPVFSRIVFLACSYHSLRLEENMTHEEAVDNIRKNAGIKFDPSMVEPFIDIIEREELY